MKIPFIVIFMRLFFLMMVAVKGSAIFNHCYCSFNKFIK